MAMPLSLIVNIIEIILSSILKSTVSFNKTSEKGQSSSSIFEGCQTSGDANPVLPVASSATGVAAIAGEYSL
jgi:hypothetical protein